jgi:branched-chain amino acid transport system permease protein
MQYTIQTIVNGISLGALYAVIAMGVALIFSVMRLVNFAHSALIMIAAYVVVALSSAPWPIWLLVAVAAAAVAAMSMEFVAFRPVRNADMTTLLVTSFAVNTMIQAFALLTEGGLAKPVLLPKFMTSSVSIGSYDISTLSFITCIVAAVALGGLGIFLRKTTPGIQMRAAAENFQMARLLGIKANRTIITAFALSGILAGLASVLLVAQLGSVTPSFGFAPVVIGFVATVVGGMGSLKGAAIGGFVLGGITIALQAWLPHGMVGYRDALLYALVIALLVFRPQGIAGTVERTA